jgi:hypothetical protein
LAGRFPHCKQGYSEAEKGKLAVSGAYGKRRLKYYKKETAPDWPS